jgi:hypothetical protein
MREGEREREKERERERERERVIWKNCLPKSNIFNV